MNKPALLLSLPTVLMLAACGNGVDTETSDPAEDFAARINGGEATPQPTQTPTVVPPRENAAPGAFQPGTATDPESATCAANRMGPFIGLPADEAIRLQVAAMAQGASEVRFITPGSDFIAADPTNPRLNMMLDAQGIIRDARCG